MSQENMGVSLYVIQCLVLLSLLQYRNVTYVLCTPVLWRVTVSLNTLSGVTFSNTEHYSVATNRTKISLNNDNTYICYLYKHKYED